MPTFNEPVFHKGAFFAVDFNGTLGVYNEGSWKILEKPRGFSNSAYVSFLVECEDDLLLVRILGFSVTVFWLGRTCFCFCPEGNSGESFERVVWWF